ncbi:zinc-binding dehydrogenase [Oculatella sp. LEGE 06141]|uniref:zinc-binding dehydrogenase n=1 Tax=Oculatella sp. LEGE 06141 TaxID=1828648 RepID=UPI0018816A84|nr:zinc-binding dehydrogenase [Oculatella sp. LEGE 06141]MBE9180153.1 zinc-binding dehydrogenase [Oculatella sp. LEGE 06141]
MLALIVDHSTAHGLRLGEIPPPKPVPHEALVRVVAVSVNFGDLQDGVAGAPDGTVPGWEAAGIVERAALDGSGPPIGTPVVSLALNGGWAELRAVDARTLGVVPNGADLGAVSTVPVAGVSALSALDRIGPLLGRRIAVTGATGGVGRFAVQLARLGGAEVIAVTGDPKLHGEALRALGADQVVAPGRLPDGLDGVVDTVGGPLLVEAFSALAGNGTLVAVGHVTEDPEVFPVGALLSRQGQDNRSLVTFFLLDSTNVGRGISWLAGKVSAGVIDPGIVWRGSWRDVDEVVEALRSRQLHGKAVLDAAAQ